MNMFLRAAAAVAAIALAGAALAGCASSSTDATASGGTDTGAKRIKFVINGTLGDKSFFDSAQAGLDEIADEYGYEVQTIELGSERTKWAPGFEDAAAAGDYDIFVAGTFDAVDFISTLAPQYPDQDFWLFDATADYDGVNGGCSNDCENVYSITFKQNEAGYLAGYMAAGTLAAGTLPGAEDATKAGVIGAVEIPVIADFLVGFEAGFEAGGGSSSDVLSQYIGGSLPFADAPRAKEIATSMYGQGAGIVWPVAGSSGFGVFEAAVEQERYAFGIDSDQSETLEKPEQQERVITSILKNVGAALVDAAQRDADGDLPYGTSESLGLKEGAVGYVDNAQYEQFVPQNVRDEVVEISTQIADGSITVPSAF
ncbi:BMP family lipoprotein [Microbacterium hominis]|uniref:BMP family ABC transporter substrate-binding protein n=1 Tax=Microbacterium hominis TaxID=162426 RepID=A0A7D4U2X4_9MICO|nr:BMP family ABC transporter substrate-binding protein [Microbacterium hominis]QKJ18245.1 BMP family ABC transporter substrate-binding protein [Microbacterium hominis]